MVDKLIVIGLFKFNQQLLPQCTEVKGNNFPGFTVFKQTDFSYQIFGLSCLLDMSLVFKASVNGFDSPCGY